MVIKQVIKNLFIVCFILCISQSLYAENYFVLEKSPESTHKSPKLEFTKPETIKAESEKLEGLSKSILKSAINAYRFALRQHEVHNVHFLTVIDFDKPSYEKRLWVIDLNNDHVIMDIHVAQGRKSGKIYATHFSNALDSHESSIGVFTTAGQPYYGAYGKSLHVKGLEAGINSNAFYRGIVIHSDTEVTPKFIDAMGYAGQTWGCFAVNPDHLNRLIQLLQGGSVIYVHASPEMDDPNVNHEMSSEGQKLYDDIVKTNLNFFMRFFHGF